MDAVFSDHIQKEDRMRIVLIDAAVEVSTADYKRLQHHCLEIGLHIVHFTDQPAPSEYVDFTLKIPQFSEEMTLKYIGVLSGLTLQMDEAQGVKNSSCFGFRVVEDFVLESIEAWGKKTHMAPKTCLAFVVHYEFLINRFEYTNIDKKALAKILVERLFNKMTYEEIVHMHESESDTMEMLNKVGQYVQ
jgi:hypothetical protein